MYAQIRTRTENNQGSCYALRNLHTPVAYPYYFLVGLFVKISVVLKVHTLCVKELSNAAVRSQLQKSIDIVIIPSECIHDINGRNGWRGAVSVWPVLWREATASSIIRKQAFHVPCTCVMPRPHGKHSYYLSCSTSAVCHTLQVCMCNCVADIRGTCAAQKSHAEFVHPSNDVGLHITLSWRLRYNVMCTCNAFTHNAYVICIYAW